MRLVDADVMLKRLQEWNTNDPIDKAHYNFTLSRIIEQPTAYDVDSVIEELETNEEFYRDMDDDFYYEGMHHAFIDAIEIVRRGGVDDGLFRCG